MQNIIKLACNAHFAMLLSLVVQVIALGFLFVPSLSYITISATLMSILYILEYVEELDDQQGQGPFTQRQLKVSIKFEVGSWFNLTREKTL